MLAFTKTRCHVAATPSHFGGSGDADTTTPVFDATDPIRNSTNPGVVGLRRELEKLRDYEMRNMLKIKREIEYLKDAVKVLATMKRSVT